MPVMGAFLSGLGFEGSDTFLSILQAEQLLAAGATPIIKVSRLDNNFAKQQSHLYFILYICTLAITVLRLCILQDLVSFSVKDGKNMRFSNAFPFVDRCTLKVNLLPPGHYDARSRVLTRHVGCLLRVCPQQLEEFEATLVEKLQGGGEESE